MQGKAVALRQVDLDRYNRPVVVLDPDPNADDADAKDDDKSAFKGAMVSLNPYIAAGGALVVTGGNANEEG